MNEVSMKDVAKKAKVSTATVSHVINNSCKVKEETTLRVNNAIKELNYKVNPIARKLRNGHSKIIGFVVADLTHYFYMEIGNSIEKVLNQNGYELFYINSNEDAAKEKKQLELCRMENFAGIIVVSVNNDWKEIEPIISNIPVIFLARKPFNISRDSVQTTNEKSCYNLTNLMISKGAKHIAFLGPQFDEKMNLRVAGFKKALLDNNLEVDEDCIIFSKSSSNILHRERLNKDWITILDYVIKDKHVDCIITGNDLFAFGAISYFRNNNIKAQKDILFATFDNTFWMHSIGIEIFCASQDTKQMGITTANLLLDRLNGKNDEFKDYCIETKLITIQS